MPVRKGFVLTAMLSLLLISCDLQRKPDNSREVDTASPETSTEPQSLSSSALFGHGTNYEYGPFDTIALSGGYMVIGKYVPDSLSSVPMEVYELWKDALITELTGWSSGAMRYDVEDVGDSFLSFMLSRGSGNPRMFALIDKRTGEALIEDGNFCDFSPSRRYLLYSDYAAETLALYDLREKKSENYSLPPDLAIVEPSYNLWIKSVTPGELEIEYLADSGMTRLRTYSRRSQRAEKEQQ